MKGTREEPRNGETTMANHLIRHDGPDGSYAVARQCVEVSDSTFDVFVEYGDGQGGYGQWNARDEADARRIAAIASEVLCSGHPSPGEAIAFRIAR